MPRMDSYHPKRSADLGSLDPLAPEIPACPEAYDPRAVNRGHTMGVRLDMLCSHCGIRALIPAESFDGTCPRCGMLYSTLTCTRCGNTWRRRGPEIPKVCPRCKSPYWCRERLKARRGTGQTPPRTRP